MSLRQLKGVDPEFLSFSLPSAQHATRLPTLRTEHRHTKTQEPLQVTGEVPAQEQHTQHKGRKRYKRSTPQLRTGLPKDQVFSGSYAALRCQPGSPAVRALVLQQALAVADLAFNDLLDRNYENTRSEILPPRQHPHRFVRKDISSSGALQTDLSHASNLPSARAPAQKATANDDSKPGAFLQ
jgi:hypothetical protein